MNVAGRYVSAHRFMARAFLMLVAVPPVLLVLSLFGLFPWSDVNC